MNQEDYMRRALELAEQGAGHTNPNPMVGCVVVKDGRIISEGYHERYGGFHAERNALTRCAEDPAGADLYVTLEPCCHHGKTPPCTDIIIEKQIARVFVGSTDSNPLVAGKGIRLLREAGIEVDTGILEDECLRLNEVFFHFIETKLPFVVMKYAMSLDGKIACATGDSKWVTGEAAREYVHELRRRYRGIMVGIGTVLADDPMLNCRIAGGVDPIRIVCDSRLRIPAGCRLVRTAREIPVIVACSHTAYQSERNNAKIRQLQDAGIQIIPTSGSHGVNLKELMAELGRQDIDSILLEGGGTLNSSALDERIVSKVYAYISPKLIGGRDAPTPVSGMGADRMSEAVQLRDLDIRSIGEDLCIRGYPVYR
ncbi:MAG: bifunctional diaminohydroxyphosphoribosylaminopyrimidine deaminase/5-amino-6-(5-phosphoribosylamino)uracil reductase RibD [Lachnospiraceae bacterium]|nr:bifunctional diaminohydroxyphosphoribosylaminopyrimidine deaminase/5-amino-6-(5-phosphoribosylamino)uracil reductase RibD [Lachnospiraceae bacterium]